MTNLDSINNVLRVNRQNSLMSDDSVGLRDVRVPPIASAPHSEPTWPQCQPQNDVYIAHCERDSSSSSVARQLLPTLESRGLSCILGERDFLPGEVTSEVIYNAVTSSRHVIMLLTRDSFLCSTWCSFTVFVSLWRMVESNRVILIPLLVDLNETEVPPCLRNITSVSMRSDPNYQEKLLAMLRGPEVTMKELLPAGNVSHGLVWSYYLNYLKDILPGMKDRIDRWCDPKVNKQCVDLRMPRKFFILVPASCFCPRGLNLADSAHLAFGGHLDDVISDKAGSMNRVYRHTVWNIARPGKQNLQFVGEYATVVHTLYQMESIRNAGLDSGQRQTQTRSFVSSLRAILDTNGHDNAEVIFFQDTDDQGRKVSLSDVLSPLVEAARVASLPS